MEAAPLLASAVEVEITPPVGGLMEGYAARVGTSQGVHDPLLAQVLLLKAGDRQVMLITVDLLGINLAFTRALREEIAQAVGLPQDSLLIACSHTHSGPAGFLPRIPGIAMPAGPERQRVLAQQLTQAAVQAKLSLQPARLGSGRGSVVGIGLNRSDPTQPVDTEVILLRVDTLAGQPMAVMMNYGCHPTVMGSANVYFSADYPGAARAALRCIYPDTMFMFANAACGDISARFTRREQSFSEVERLGRLLGGEALKIMQTVLTLPSAHLESRVIPVEIPYRPFPPPLRAQQELDRLEAELAAQKAAGAPAGDLRKAVTRVEGAQGQLLMARELAGSSGVTSEVQVLEIGDLALVGLPGEVFTQTGLAIKQASRCPLTGVIGYANDYQGYFPDAAAIDQGSYEALISPFGADAAGQLASKVIHLLNGSVHVSNE